MTQVFLAWFGQGAYGRYIPKLLEVCTSKEIAQAVCEESRTSKTRFYQADPSKSHLAKAVQQAEWIAGGMELHVVGAPIQWFITMKSLREELP